MTTLPLDLVDIEIEEPSEGAFVLGISMVGDLLSPAGAAMEWFPVTCEATSLSINRGGQVDGPSTSIDVGTMSLRYVDGPDPADDIRIRPGVRCRVRTTPEVIEWGFESSDGSPAYTADTYGPNTPTFTLHPDAARSGSFGGLGMMKEASAEAESYAHFIWTQTGLIPGVRYRLSFWFRRVNTSLTVYVDHFHDHDLDMTYSESHADVGDPPEWIQHVSEFTAVVDTSDLYVQAYSTGVDVAHVIHFDDFEIEPIATLYTGTIEDIETTYDEEHVFTRISATDAVRSLASTPRYGVVRPPVVRSTTSVSAAGVVSDYGGG